VVDASTESVVKSFAAAIATAAGHLSNILLTDGLGGGLGGGGLGGGGSGGGLGGGLGGGGLGGGGLGGGLGGCIK
jgi:hypothetical protein